MEVGWGGLQFSSVLGYFGDALYVFARPLEKLRACCRSKLNSTSQYRELEQA